MPRMDLTNPSGRKSVTTDTPRERDVKLRCELSKALEEAGDYQRACETLGGLWPPVGERPHLSGLDRRTSGRRPPPRGALTGLVGEKRQTEGFEEKAQKHNNEAGG